MVLAITGESKMLKPPVPLEVQVERVGVVRNNADPDHVGVMQAVPGGARDPVLESAAVAELRVGAGKRLDIGRPPQRHPVERVIDQQGAIHRLSGRREKPFLGVNCASLNENLMESELFGHVRGAFTGAVKDRMGRFEMAEGGTLFLDEVPEIGPHLQAKLLRVVQEREYQRVGETRTRKADVRILSATNKRLKDLLAGGSFRDDLYYRLNVVSIIPPPLRERKEDIPVLVDHFLDRSREHHGGLRRSFSPLAMRVLLEYSWPGNVRELENALERARICSRGEVIEESALPAEIRRRGRTTHGGAWPAGEALVEPEEGKIREALARSRGNRGEAAAQLGISRVTLWRRMKRMSVSA